jgi:chromosome segregation ATPase
MARAISRHDTTGRYLGIDGYFLYGESTNWVYCYCKPCWQNEILKLSFVSNALNQKMNALEQENNSLQQEITTSEENSSTLQQEFDTLQQKDISLQQQLNASQQNQDNLRQQLNASQEQLSSARSETVSHQKQLIKITEKYEKLCNTSGIENLRNLLKQLSSSQIDALHKHTNFRADTFEIVHSEKQLQCSSLFVQSSLQELKSNVDSVI